ncbi:Protein kinase C, partial [Pristimantis euphronides]
MSDRVAKKRKMTSEEEETPRSLSCYTGDIRHSSSVDVNLPRDAGTGEEAPAKRMKQDGIAEGKVKSKGLAPKSDKDGQSHAIKRKRDDSQEENGAVTGGESGAESCNVVAKKPRKKAPSKRMKQDGIAEGKVKSKGLAPKSDKDGQSHAIKRKRDDSQEENGAVTGGESGAESCNVVAKKPRLDANSPQEAAGKCSVQTSEVPSIDTLFMKSLNTHGFIGEGTFGKVILASDATTGRRLAVKMVPKKNLLSVDQRKMAENEKQVLEIASGSPFLCGSCATFQSAHHIFYVMDYLAGGDLGKLIKNKGPFDEDTIRDLHSGNIFVDGAGHCKIGDFGWSRMNTEVRNR